MEGKTAMKPANSTGVHLLADQAPFLNGCLDDVIKWLARKTRILAIGDVAATSLQLAHRGFQTTAVLDTIEAARKLQQIASRQDIPLRVDCGIFPEYVVRGLYDLILLNDCLQALDTGARRASILDLKAHSRLGGYHIITESTPASQYTTDGVDPAGAEVCDHYSDWTILHQSDFVAREYQSELSSQRRIVRLVATKRSRS